MNDYAKHIATDPGAIAFANELKVSLEAAIKAGDQEKVGRIRELINQFYATATNNGKTGIHMAVMG